MKFAWKKTIGVGMLGVFIGFSAHAQGTSQPAPATSATPAAAAATVTLERVYLPEKKKETQLIEGSPNEAAAKLVEKLKFEVRVI